MISFEEFKKIELRVARVINAERIEGSEKLLRLSVDLGMMDSEGSEGKGEVLQVPEVRQIIAGIGKAYAPESLVGRAIIIVANLEPKSLMGLESHGMLLAADADIPVLLMPEKEVPPGTKIR